MHNIDVRPGQQFEIHAYHHQQKFDGHEIWSQVMFVGSIGKRSHQLQEGPRIQHAGWSLHILRPTSGERVSELVLHELANQLVHLDNWHRVNFTETARPTIMLVLLPTEGSIHLSKTEKGVALDGLPMWFAQTLPVEAASQEALREWSIGVASLIAHEVAHYMAWAGRPYSDPVEDELAAYLLETCFELESRGAVGSRLVRISGSPEVAAVIAQGDLNHAKRLLERRSLHPTLAGRTLAHAVLARVTSSQEISIGSEEGQRLLGFCKAAATERENLLDALIAISTGASNDLSDGAWQGHRGVVSAQ
ncbi:MAG: hypothetical protein ING59_14015 [Burkholderiales bacterium]|nr:hypothetical protein [Burkholderiales bacterium]